MVPAYAATLLKHNGYDVVWDDGIAEEKSYDKWLNDIINEEPDIIAIETKTPVVKKHWKIINELKEYLPKTKIVLMGDHVTALPLESFENSKVDFVITGGDYDFMLLNLVKWLEGKDNLEPGFYYKDEDGHIKNTGRFILNHDLNSLPFIDRDLTKWWLYAYKNGNYKRTPGTYTMAGRDCWWRENGGCSFCAWTTLYPNYRVRNPELLVDEIGMLIEKYKVKEIFDDTGSFPSGEWLRKFANMIIERGYNEEIYIGCNMRFGALTKKDYELLAKAGFRMILCGLESASNETLKRINKGVTVERITEELKWASEAGLEPHITIMVGYPWETKEEAMKTVKLARWLFEKGYASTLQATIVVPYPGTKMFEDMKEQGLLMTYDWDDYDMRKLVIKAPIDDNDVKELTRELYKSFLTPKYVMRRILSIRSKEDLEFILRGAKKVIGHLKDFSPSN
ncbi:B12-binding domain-containing radical SAM protein [Methanocaldococcus indicus]|uniref:B12-binding domain-containing radical SAM protein n=1 Tax=Methanocaldococcus indicus TaxID=213231 RepID=UPI003C6D52CC